jgi:hypothetical protein
VNLIEKTQIFTEKKISNCRLYRGVDTGLRFCSRQLCNVRIFRVFSWNAWIVGVFYELCALLKKFHKMLELLTKFHDSWNAWIFGKMHRFSIDFFRLQQTKCHYFGITSFARLRMWNFKIIIKKWKWKWEKLWTKKFDSCTALITRQKPIYFSSNLENVNNIM